MTAHPDPARLRIGDDDRRRLAEFLATAAAAGRLDEDELAERLEATTAAKTYGDLVPIVVDLPGTDVLLDVTAPGPLSPPPGTVESYPAYEPDREPRPEPPLGPSARPIGMTGMPLTSHGASVAVLGGQDRKGVWVIPPSHNAVVLMGGVTIDLREAVFQAPVTVITAVVVMGGLEIVVNANTRVVVDGVGIMGGFGEERPKVTPTWDATSPVVRVRGLALMGGVGVTRKPMPGEKKPRRLRRG